MHLSQYCAYLMAWYPDLLPDDDGWSKSLYDNIKKDAVLKTGVRLGKQLAELREGEGDQEAAWKLLAGFWSEMILYVAPSDNLKGHSEAISRGGELITLLWTMLFHAGIVDRPTESSMGVA
ncbi:hypothetical protein PR202_gb12186 [Eleusine coracana subsp. coracana]|uniref:DUF4220 domain-containing protein n=1 Tax=Eleusine coracana subsp. coracana TaxID=191504 RepID=A0AAV5EM53_ELECO|nr:hypothetical protein PR202_gb12186 [Eleusine coracana subsp. coracana]